MFWLRNKKNNFQLRTLIQFLTNGSKSLIRTLAQDQFIFFVMLNSSELGMKFQLLIIALLLKKSDLVLFSIHIYIHLARC